MSFIPPGVTKEADSGHARLIQYLKVNAIHYINRLHKKAHMFISIHAFKAFDRIQYSFVIKKKQP